MKLYYSPGACSLVVRIILNELHVPCDFEKVNLKNKRTENDQDFLKINTKGMVPTLEIKKGEVITEAAVILQYLADHHDDYNLLAKVGEMKRYRVLEWMNFVSTELHKGLSPLFNPQLPNDYRTHFLLPNVFKKLQYINDHLKGPYLLGENFSLADAYLFVMLNWLSFFKIDRNQWQKLSNFYDEMTKRPAVRESLEQEKLLVKA